jgi:hypothetical protein
MTVQCDVPAVSATGGPAAFSRRMTTVLVALSVAHFLVALDYPVNCVALLSAGSGLGLPVDRLQWVVSAYAAFFANFLVAGAEPCT